MRLIVWKTYGTNVCVVGIFAYRGYKSAAKIDHFCFTVNPL